MLHINIILNLRILNLMRSLSLRGADGGGQASQEQPKKEPTGWKALILRMTVFPEGCFDYVESGPYTVLQNRIP